MAISFKKVSSRVFAILRGSGHKVVMYNDNGDQIYNPEDATRFYALPEKFMVTILNSGEDSAINVYLSGTKTDTETPDIINKADEQYDKHIKNKKNSNKKSDKIAYLASLVNNMTKLVNNIKNKKEKEPDINIDKLQKILISLRLTATLYNLEFTVRKFGYALTPKDFAYQSEINKELKEGHDMKINEAMTGTNRSSYQKIGNVTIIIRHALPIDDSIIGARGRNIKYIFIETPDRERFRLPANNIYGARAMARHICNNGTFNDDIGNKIQDLCREWRNLLGISSYMKENNQSITDHSQARMYKTAIKDRIYDINESLKNCSKTRSYQKTIESLNEVNEVDHANVTREVNKIMDCIGLEECNEAFLEGLHSLANCKIGFKKKVNNEDMVADDVTMEEKEEDDIEIDDGINDEDIDADPDDDDEEDIEKSDMDNDLDVNVEITKDNPDPNCPTGADIDDDGSEENGVIDHDDIDGVYGDEIKNMEDDDDLEQRDLEHTDIHSPHDEEDEEIKTDPVKKKDHKLALNKEFNLNDEVDPDIEEAVNESSEIIDLNKIFDKLKHADELAFKNGAVNFEKKHFRDLRHELGFKLKLLSHMIRDHEISKFAKHLSKKVFGKIRLSSTEKIYAKKLIRLASKRDSRFSIINKKAKDIVNKHTKNEHEYEYDITKDINDRNYRNERENKENKMKLGRKSADDNMKHYELSKHFENYMRQFDLKNVLKEESDLARGNKSDNKFNKGDQVYLIATPEINRSAFPNTKWIDEGKKIKVTLLDDAIQGSIDLINVRLENKDEIKQAYGFNIFKRAEQSEEIGEDQLWEIAMNLVKWKNHPEQIMEISKKLKEKHIFRILEHIEKIWQSDMSDKIRNIIFDNKKYTEILINEDNSDLIMEDVKINFVKISDMILAGNLLDNKNIYYDSEKIPGNNILIREVDVPTIKKIFNENKINYKISEFENDILGGNDRDDFIKDVSRQKRADMDSAGDVPEFKSNHVITLSKDKMQKAERYLDSNNIKYNSYANGKIEFHNETDKKQAEAILRTYQLLENKQPEMAKIIKIVEYFNK